MRINIYADELTERVESEKKTPKNTDTEHVGIQFFVGREFEHTPGDDDSSAVIFWYHSAHERTVLLTALKNAIREIENNPAPG